SPSAAERNVGPRSADSRSNKCRSDRRPPTRHSSDAPRSRPAGYWKTMSPTREQNPIRLLIADDRPRTRRALRALLATHARFVVIGEAADGEEAVASVERLRPDLVLLDVWMPRLDGIAATARIKARWPAVRVVVLSLAVER